MRDVPPMDKAFAYVTHGGETLLMGEVAQEIGAKMEVRGVTVNQGAIEAVMRAFRYVTEAIGRGYESHHGGIQPWVVDGVRGQRVILGEETVTAILRQLMQTLSAMDVSGVTYFDGSRSKG